MKSIPKNNQPNAQLLKALKDQTHPYGHSSILGAHGYQLAEIEYKSCLKLYKIFGTKENNTLIARQLMSNMQRVQQLEQPFKEQLEQLAQDVVLEFLKISQEDIQIQATLNPEMEVQIPEEKVLDVDQEKLKPHVEKRIILNALVHGGAVQIWKMLHFIVRKKLDKINPELFILYNKIIADSSYLMWQAPPLSPEQAKKIIEMPGVIQGQNQVDINEEEERATVTATATMFPTMIHEIVKGIFDIVILHGIDESLTEDELEYVYQQADQLYDESWYVLMGPGLWSLIVSNYVDNPKELPEIIQEVSLTSTPVIIEELKRIINETTRNSPQTEDET